MSTFFNAFELFIYRHPVVVFFPLFIICLFLKSQIPTSSKDVFKIILIIIFFILLITITIELGKFIIIKLLGGAMG
jgi:hypothetical protein